MTQTITTKYRLYVDDPTPLIRLSETYRNACNFVSEFILGAGCYLSYTFACACNSDSSSPEPKVFAIGIVIFVIGGYLSALFVYAFGALVDSSIETEYNTKRLLKEQKKIVAMLEEEPDTPSPDMMRP